MEQLIEPRWKEANKRFYAENRERELARAKAYYHANKEKRAEYQKRWRSENRARIDEKRRLWELNNPEKSKVYRAKITLAARCKKRGITIEQYFDMLGAQGGKCKICRRGNTGTKAQWHIDHCHSTGKVRGLLCHHCNAGLGHVQDNVDVLKAMISYLSGE